MRFSLPIANRNPFVRDLRDIIEKAHSDFHRDKDPKAALMFRQKVMEVFAKYGVFVDAFTHELLDELICDLENKREAYRKRIEEATLLSNVENAESKSPCLPSSDKPFVPVKQEQTGLEFQKEEEQDSPTSSQDGEQSTQSEQ